MIKSPIVEKQASVNNNDIFEDIISAIAQFDHVRHNVTQHSIILTYKGGLLYSVVRCKAPESRHIDK